MPRVLVGVLLLVAGCSSVRPVASGAVYRSGQLSPPQLAEAVRRHDIKTVVNLRGREPEARWYQVQKAALDRLNVRQIDVAFSGEAPNERQVAELMDVYRRAEKPLLVHSRSANGSVGLASGLYRVGVGRETNDAARKELAFWQWGRLPAIVPGSGYD
ncbi:MAG TPA: hypothetical protein VNC50_19640, partial [Planctomycetia bacterium]|nr:hypothetical protein [Planctomycetia bacterium]